MLIKMDIIVKNVCCISNNINEMLVNLTSDGFIFKSIFLLEKVADVIRRNLPSFDLARMNKVGGGKLIKNMIIFNHDHILISRSFNIL